MKTVALFVYVSCLVLEIWSLKCQKRTFLQFWPYVSKNLCKKILNCLRQIHNLFIFTSKLSLQLETSLSIKLLKQEIPNKKRKLRTIRRNLTSMTNKLSGWFNNYVTLKLPFLTHLPPYPPPSCIVTFVHENPLALRHAQHKHCPPTPSQ